MSNRRIAAAQKLRAIRQMMCRPCGALRRSYDPQQTGYYGWVRPGVASAYPPWPTRRSICTVLTLQQRG